jgi:hypothetical protein
MTVDEVLAVLQATSIPSRDIDASIAEIVAASGWQGQSHWRPETDLPARARHADSYTASLDAAFSLVEHVLPGRSVHLDWHPDQGRAEASIGDADAADGATPALAVVTALFRVLRQREA